MVFFFLDVRTFHEDVRVDGKGLCGCREDIASRFGTSRFLDKQGMEEGGERGQGNFDELSNIFILAFRSR